MGKKQQEEILHELAEEQGITAHELARRFAKKRAESNSYGFIFSTISFFSKSATLKLMTRFQSGVMYSDLMTLEDERKIFARPSPGPRPRQYYYYLVKK